MQTGRILSIQSQDRKELILFSNGRIIQKNLSSPLPKDMEPGDWIQEEENQITLLQKKKEGPYFEKITHPRRIHALQIRSWVERGIRNFFEKKGFLETRTPLLVPCPGMEPHIRPLELQSPGSRSFLPTSPEFAMKRLLAGGMDRIFQICPAFRSEPFSHTHHPEFTILEWYRAFSDEKKIMEDVENLFSEIAISLFGKPSFQYQGKTISVATPWPRLSIDALFLEKTGIDLEKNSTLPLLSAQCEKLGISVDSQDTWDDLYFKIWLNLIEPKLPEDQAVFVFGYPPSQAALSVVEKDSSGRSRARRFEAYAGGLELGNAFYELTDPKEQRSRFEKDMNLRETLYGKGFPKNPIDEGFIAALEEGLPPSGGIAMGVDRMVMLFADESEIDYTLWLSSHWEANFS